MYSNLRTLHQFRWAGSQTLPREPLYRIHGHCLKALSSKPASALIITMIMAILYYHALRYSITLTKRGVHGLVLEWVIKHLTRLLHRYGITTLTKFSPSVKM